MITEYELYSDERKEKHNGNSYPTIGGLVCTDKGRDRLLAKLKPLRGVLTGEVRWKKISTFMLELWAWVDFFVDDSYTRYFLLLVNQTSSSWQAFRRQLHRTKNQHDPLAYADYQFL